MIATSHTIRSDWRQFQIEWENVQASWKDEVAERFRQHFLNDWNAQLPGLLRTLEELEAIAREADRIAP